LLNILYCSLSCFLSTLFGMVISGVDTVAFWVMMKVLGGPRNESSV
jgi:hypothetical protein